MKSLTSLERSRPCTVVRHVYVELTGDLTAGILLSQLSYWFAADKSGNSKLRVFKMGRPWVAKSRHEWARECSIGVRMFDGALRRLEAMGIVERKIMRFNGSPTIHLWLDVSRVTSLLEAQLPDWKGPFASTEHIDLPAAVNSLTETTEEQNTYSNKPAGETGVTNKAKSRSATAIEEQGQKPNSQKSKAKNELKSETRAHGLALAKHWRACQANLPDCQFAKPLTYKEQALLKQVMDAAGTSAKDLVEFCIRHWSAFTWEVKSTKVVDKAPDFPEVWFFRKHYEVGMKLMGAKPPPHPSVKKNTPTFDKGIHAWASSKQSAHIPATKEQIVAMIAAFAAEEASAKTVSHNA